MDKARIKVSPDIYTYTSEDCKTLVIELKIPGVEKKDIDVRMLDDVFSVKALRDDVEFSQSLLLCCPVNIGEAHAEYQNGVLRVEAPYKDFMEKAVRIAVA